MSGKGAMAGGRRAAILLPLFLAACASNPPAPVEERSLGSERSWHRVDPGSPPVKGPTHRVIGGDTVYGIAFKNGLDYRDLARWNRIGPPYRIDIGQVLRLTPHERVDRVAEAELAAAIAAESSPPPKPTTPVVVAVARPPLPAPRPIEPPPPAPPATITAPAEVPAVAAVSRPQPPGMPEENTPIPAPVSPPPVPAATLTSGGIAWRWPTPGKVVGTFVSGDPTRQGVDIAGNAGDPVHAAADGTIVYSGNGLIGYGELVIVKHSPAYLSAYGHNRKRLVKEGDAVKAGQTIAEMGARGAREMLHFEIRKSGKPANPLEFLPAR